MTTPLTAMELKFLQNAPMIPTKSNQKLQIAVALFIEKYPLENLCDPNFVKEHSHEMEDIVTHLHNVTNSLKKKYATVWQYLSRDEPIVFDCHFSSEEMKKLEQQNAAYASLAAEDVISNLHFQLQTQWKLSKNSLMFTEIQTWTKDPEDAFLYLFTISNEYGNLAVLLNHDLKLIEDTLTHKTEQALDILTPAKIRPLSEEEETIFNSISISHCRTVWPKSISMLLKENANKKEECIDLFLKFLEMQKKRYPHIFEALKDGVFPTRPSLLSSSEDEDWKQKISHLPKDVIYEAIELSGISLQGKWYFNKTKCCLTASIPVSFYQSEEPVIKLLKTVFNSNEKDLAILDQDIKNMSHMEKDFETALETRNKYLSRNTLGTSKELRSFLTAVQNGKFNSLPEIKQILDKIDILPELEFAVFKLKQRFSHLSQCLFQISHHTVHVSYPVSVEKLAAYLSNETRAQEIAENWRISDKGHIYCTTLLYALYDSDDPFLFLLSQLPEKDIMRLNSDAALLFAIDPNHIKFDPSMKDTSTSASAIMSC